MLTASSGDDKIRWYESDGGLLPTFTERIISTTADGAYSVHAADVDGDQDMDVLSASADDNTVAWYENDGGSPPEFTKRIISATQDSPRSVYATDLDGDDDTDVLCTAVDRVIWFENDGGSPPIFTKWLISKVNAAGRSVYAADLNGDGDLDVLSAWNSNDVIAWHESTGLLPPTFAGHVISTSALGAESVYAADVDGDGHVDVLSASNDDDKIAWYVNDGGAPPRFTERVIEAAADGAQSVFTVDLDRDGDVDVLSAAQNGEGEVAWYESLNPGASVRGMRATRVSCGNLTTGRTGGDGSHQGTSWTCRELQVPAAFGDRVRLIARGRVPGEFAVGGSVEGLTPGPSRLVSCQNLTTAQTIQFRTDVDSWNCEDEGLNVAAGDLVQQSVTGER